MEIKLHFELSEEDKRKREDFNNENKVSDLVGKVLKGLGIDTIWDFVYTTRAMDCEGPIGYGAKSINTKIAKWTNIEKIIKENRIIYKNENGRIAINGDTKELKVNGKEYYPLHFMYCEDIDTVVMILLEASEVPAGMIKGYNDNIHK